MAPLAPCLTCAGTGEDFHICPSCDGIGYEYLGATVDKCSLCCDHPVIWTDCHACGGMGSQIAADLLLMARAASMPSIRKDNQA